MARRSRDEDSDVIAEYYGQQRQDPLTQALALLKLQQGSQGDIRDLAFKERQARADELYRRGQLEAGRQQESRLAAGAEEAKRQYGEEKAIRQREREEDVAREKEKETLALSEKERDRLAREREHQVDVVKELYPEGSPERKKRLETLDPEYAKIAQGLAAEKLTGDVEANLEKYKNASPKQRAAYKMDPGAIGGKEALAELEKRVGAEEAAGAPRPDLAPKVGTAPVSAVGQGAAWQHMIPSSAMAPPEFPQAPYLKPEEYGMESDEGVKSRIESDPRYMSAEQQLLTNLKDWWNKPAEPSFTSAPGGPSAMPPTVQQPGYLDNLLRRANAYDPMAW